MKKVTIDKEKCIGCGACEATVPEVYEIIDQLAIVHEDKINDQNYDSVLDAASGCPVDAIIVSED